MACGNSNTILLKKSFGREVGDINMNIHLNLRIGAKFKDNISGKRNDFTSQIQEFLDDGVILCHLTLINLIRILKFKDVI